MPSSNPTSARRAGAGGPSTGRLSTQPGFFSRGGRHGGGGGIIRVESTSTTAAAAAAHRSVQPAAELVDQYASPSSIATLSPPPRKPPVPYLSKLSSVAKQQQQEVHYPVVVEEEDDKDEAAEGKQGRRKQKECDSTTTTPRNNQKDGGDQHNNNTSGYTTTPRRRKKEEIAKDDEDGCSSTRTTPRLGAMSAEAAPPAPKHLAGGEEVDVKVPDAEMEMSNKSAPQQHQEGAPASAAQRSTTSLASPSERVVPHKIHPDASTGKPLQYFNSNNNSKSCQSSKDGTSSDAVQEQKEQRRMPASDVELKCAAFIQASAKRQQLVEALKLNFSSSRTNLQYFLEKQQNTIQHLQERCDKNSEELHTERSNARRQQQGHYYHSPKSSATVMASIMKMPTAAELRARFALDSPVGDAGESSPVSQQQQQQQDLQNGRGVREEESAAPLTHNESIFELPPKDSGEDSVVVPTTVVTLSPPPQEDEEDHHHHQRSVVGNESLFSIGGRSITPSKEEGDGPSSNRLHMQQQQQNDYDDNNSLSDTVGNLMAQYARQQQQQQQQGHQQQQQQPLSPTPPLQNDHHQGREVSNDSIIVDVPSPTGIASAETKATDEGGSPRSPKWSTQYTGGSSFARSSSGHHLIPKLGEREGSYALTENDSLVFAPESGSGSPTAAAGLDDTIGSSVSIPHDFAGNNHHHDDDDDDGSMSTISSRAPSCSPPGSARRGGPGRGASPINKDLL